MSIEGIASTKYKPILFVTDDFVEELHSYLPSDVVMLGSE